MGDSFSPNSEYANRIIFLTDAQPNASTAQNKRVQIHSTFIGVGLDFNTEFVECAVKNPGANYYAVHSNDEFMKTMRDEFKFMVTPLVFDFVLSLMAEGSATCIQQAFGTGDDERTIGDNGEVMNVNSIFASQHDADDRVKGGAVLLRLKTKVKGKAKGVFYEIAVRATYNDID